MLYAIGIYNCTNEEKPTPIASAHRHAGFTSLFDGNMLADLEKESLPKAIQRRENQLLSLVIDIYQRKDEWHYVQRLMGDSSHIYIAVCSQKALTQVEANRLFHNIQIIHARPNRVSATLQTVVDDPLRFIRPQDILMQDINQTVDDMKCVMLKNIDLALARGEKIEELMGKAIDLDGHAVKFEKQASKAKPFCSSC